MYKAVCQKDSQRAKTLKSSGLMQGDWDTFVEELTQVYLEVVLDDSASDLVLSETWFIRKMIQFGVPRPEAPLLWQRQEDEFGNKLKSETHDGVPHLVLPGLKQRSMTKRRRMVPGGQSPRDPFDTPQARVPGARSRSAAPHSGEARGGFDGNSRRSRSLTRSRRRPREPQTRSRHERGGPTPRSSGSHAGSNGQKGDGSKLPRPIHNGKGLLEFKRRQQGNGSCLASDSSSAAEEEEEADTSEAGGDEDDTAVWIQKTFQKIRDSPDTYEQSVDMFRMAEIVERYWKELSQTEQVQ